MLKVTVPATSANLGPGFDSLGIALDLYNHFYFLQMRREEPSGVTILRKEVSCTEPPICWVQGGEDIFIQEE
jgi:homoserine kinase